MRSSAFRSIFPVILFAGLLAEGLFELYAWLISPIIFGETLEPANLVMGLFQRFLSVELSYVQGFSVHAFIGAVVFPVAVYIIARVLNQRFVLAGVVTGVALWFMAQGILAPLMGRNFMMGFGAYTQSSFVGHVGMTLIVGFIFARVWLRDAALQKL
ncbi:hypothetical protein [uncultured Roseobacter sp.]|uniref:hypothetical protein n=1 Tax=uncultured Roseobacter sp. TaxID=114847 RepID=UPI002602F377|nr:hypothetical protein [uncultured Roseobacter sp.]